MIQTPASLEPSPVRPDSGEGVNPYTAKASQSTSPSMLALVQVAQSAFEAGKPLTIDELAKHQGIARATAQVYARAARRSGLNVPIRTIGSTRSRNVALVLAWINGLSATEFLHEDVAAAVPDLAATHELRKRAASKALLHLKSSGHVELIGRRDGWRRVGAPSETGRPITTVSLSGIAAGAATQGVSHKPARGHRALDAWEGITGITSSQHRDVRTAINAIAKHYQLSESDPLPLELIAWDPIKDDWSGLLAVASGASAGKILAGGRLVLHLAANCGLITRAEVHPAPIAPALLKWIEEIASEVVPESGPARNETRGCLRTLARSATELGWRDPSQVNWGRVREALDAERYARPRPPAKWS